LKTDVIFTCWTFSCYSCLPEAVLKLSVPSCLLREEKNSGAAGEDKQLSVEPVSKLQLLQLAVRCYTRSIHCNSSESFGESWSLWQQLGLAFSSLARLEPGQGHGARALRALKQAVRLAGGQQQQQHTAWTALGTVAAQQEDWPLAQHAFIK
jgi:hypothetical protein